jgi:hypothetical protein
MNPKQSQISALTFPPQFSVLNSKYSAENTGILKAGLL